MRWILPSCLFLLSAAFAVPTPAAAQAARNNTTQTVSGRLIFVDGADVACQEIVVELELDETQVIDSTYLDSTCNFKFARANAGSYDIHVNIDGYEEVRQPIEIGPGGSAGSVQIPMSPAPSRSAKGPQSRPLSNVIDVSEFLQQYPRKAVDLYKKSLDSRKKANKDRAIDQLEAAIKIAPEFFQAQYDVGLLYSDAKQFDKAEVHYLKAHELNRSAIEPLVNLSRLYIHENKPEEAVQVSEQAIETNSRSAPAFFNLGVALYRMSRLDKAEDALMKALALAPKMFQVHLALANVYLQWHKYDRLIAQLDAYLAENPGGEERDKVKRMREQILKAKDGGS